MQKIIGVVLFVALVACGGAQVRTESVVEQPSESDASIQPTVTTETTETSVIQSRPMPYTQDESCQSFHDNDLVGKPYAMGFHYCIYAEGSDAIVGCTLDPETQRSICFNQDIEPEAGVQWDERPGVVDGELYVPQDDAPLATIHGELKQISGGRVMYYVISFSDGTHSGCIVGGPTVQYCRIDW